MNYFFQMDIKLTHRTHNSQRCRRRRHSKFSEIATQIRNACLHGSIRRWKVLK